MNPFLGWGWFQALAGVRPGQGRLVIPSRPVSRRPGTPTLYEKREKYEEHLRHEGSVRRVIYAGRV